MLAATRMLYCHIDHDFQSGLNFGCIHVFHIGLPCLQICQGNLPQIIRQGNFHGSTLPIFMRHAQGAVHQIAEAIAELGIVALDKPLLAEIGVVSRGGITHQIVAERGHPVGCCEFGGIDHISRALADFLPTQAPETMNQQLRHLIIGKSHGVQHTGPVNSMGGNEDILADHMMITGPTTFKASPIITVFGEADVIDQGIKPDIGNKFRIKGQLDSPGQTTLGA